MAIKGQSSPIKTTGSTITLDDRGVASATENYILSGDGLGFALEKRYGPYPHLKRKSATITKIEGGFTTVSITYEGIPPGKGGDDGESEDLDPKYSLDLSTSSEPIDTHPDFVELIGGTIDDTKNNAQFDPETGAFKEFPPTLEDKVTPNPKAGIKTFLSCSAIYSEEKTYTKVGDTTIGSIAGLGKINTPPPSAFLPEVAGRTWLLIGGTVTQVGDGAVVKRKWRLSGERGWDTDIYSA